MITLTTKTIQLYKDVLTQYTYSISHPINRFIRADTIGDGRLLTHLQITPYLLTDKAIMSLLITLDDRQIEEIGGELDENGRMPEDIKKLFIALTKLTAEEKQ